jgi:hypothetical protein
LGISIERIFKTYRSENAAYEVLLVKSRQEKSDCVGGDGGGTGQESERSDMHGGLC